MGVKLMPLPEEPYIRFAGLLSERERLQALEAADGGHRAVAFESLSLLALEAFAWARRFWPTRAARCSSTTACRSNAGLFYADRDEFVECLTLLMADDRLRARWAATDATTSSAHYRWDVILGKYDRLIAGLTGAGSPRTASAGR